MTKDELLALLRLCNADPSAIDAVELAYELGFKAGQAEKSETYPDNFIDALKYDMALREFDPDYRTMYLKVRDELAALQQSRAPLTSKEIRAIEVDVATNLSLDYPSPAEQFTRAIEARHGIKEKT